MKNNAKVLILIGLLSTGASAQTKPKAAAKPQNVKPSIKPAEKSAVKPTAKSVIKSNAKPPIKTETKPSAKPKTLIKAEQAAKPIVVTKPTVYKGEVVGNTYTNRIYNFEITLPEDWEIPGDDFEDKARRQGFNLNLEAPKAANPKIQSKLNQMTTNVSVLLNAFKVAAGTDENAFLRVSIEDLQDLPQVKDAVDYFDLMRETYKNVKLPADFRYSETQAERLGKWQFGFLDASNKAGKKRMYATVRNGYALMFTLTYKSDAVLAALRNVLAAGNFRLR